MIAIVVGALFIALILAEILNITGSGFYVLFGLCIAGVVVWGILGSRSEQHQFEIAVRENERKRDEAYRERKLAEAKDREMAELRSENRRLKEVAQAATCSKYKKRGDGHCANCGIHYRNHKR